MSQPPGQHLTHEHSGSSNDVDYPLAADDQAGPLARQSFARNERQNSSSKRPYRQRRKDPSCDACRERKVKCDASESTACSECSTRGVPCCFTKESNRRMSSLKQIQELEDRLSRAKQEVVQLRLSLVQRQGERSHDLSDLVRQSTLSTDQIVDGRSTASSPTRSNQAALMASVSWRRSTSCIYVEELPPKQLTLQLLQIYEQIIHDRMPIVPLENVQRELDKLYQYGKLDGVPQGWRGMLMAMFACALQAAKPPTSGFMPEQFLQLAIASIDQSWSSPLTLDHVRLTLLVASYFFEENLHTASMLWYRTTSALASKADHSPSYGLSVEEARCKHALSVSLAWFRLTLLALQPRQPLAEGDPKIGWIAIKSGPSSAPDLSQSTTERNLTIMDALLQALPANDSMGDAAPAQSFEMRVELIIATLPSVLDSTSTSPLTPEDTFPAFAIQMAWMLASLQQLDRSGLTQALLVATNTARIVLRARAEEDSFSMSASTWTSDFRSRCSSLLCLHLWRCQMVLCLGGQLDFARLLLSLSTAIGDATKVNRSCALCLIHYTDQLIESIEAGGDPTFDERILALVRDSLDNQIMRASRNTSFRSTTSGRDSVSLRRGSSDETVFSEGKDDTIRDDEWTILDRKLARLEELHRLRVDRVTVSSPSQSSRSRMQISNIIK